VNTSSGTPAGFTAVPGSGIYAPTPPPTQSPNDYRLGNNLDVPVVALPHPGEETGVGQVDPTASMTPSYLKNAPIYSALALHANGFSYATGTAAGPGQTEVAAGLSNSDILRLRGEMIQNVRAQENLHAEAVALAKPPAGPGAAANTGELVVTPITGQLSGTTPLTAGNTPPATFNPPGAPVVENSVPVNTGSTGQSVRYSLDPLPAPAEQSAQYAKLQDLLNQFDKSHPTSDEEANRLFQEALKARRAYEQNQPRRQPPGSLAPPPPAPAENSSKAAPATPSLPPPSPLDVGPIAQSIRGEGLAKLMADAETLAKHQQFKDAIGKFLDARRVAPNNMLIVVDLANAELGAGFYAQSEEYLRMAFTSDPALLMGKYDLHDLLGDDRTQILIADLKRVASNTDTATPVFLLAYVSYSMGETEKAMDYLQLAQTRAGGQDELITSLRQHWLLPATQPSRQ
jgi:hypothetical protein